MSFIKTAKKKTPNGLDKQKLIEALPERPGKEQLGSLVDNLVEGHHKLEELVSELKSGKADLEAHIRANDGTCKEIKAYLVKHLQRLGLANSAGDVWKAVFGEAAESYEWDGDVKDIPDAFAKVERSLNKAACKAAVDRKEELPTQVLRSKTAFVKFVRV